MYLVILSIIVSIIMVCLNTVTISTVIFSQKFSLLAPLFTTEQMAEKLLALQKQAATLMAGISEL